MTNPTNVEELIELEKSISGFTSPTIRLWKCRNRRSWCRATAVKSKMPVAMNIWICCPAASGAST